MSATKRFQAWLIKARKKAELSYGQLADKSGVSGGAIHSIEHGGGSPSLDTADKLAKALGTHLEYAVRTRDSKGRSAEPASSSDPAADA